MVAGPVIERPLAVLVRAGPEEFPATVELSLLDDQQHVEQPAPAPPEWASGRPCCE